MKEDNVHYIKWRDEQNSTPTTPGYIHFDFFGNLSGDYHLTVVDKRAGKVTTSEGEECFHGVEPLRGRDMMIMSPNIKVH